MSTDPYLAVPVGAKPLPADVLKLQAIMASDPRKGRDPTGAWDQAWKAKITPWDHTSIQPALKELIETKWVEGSELERLVPFGSLKDGIALVAGCGRGYDATYFASKGFKSSWGIDISPTAVEVAQEYLLAQPDHPINVEFKALDFFNFNLGRDDKFSLAYDYTFLCALPIELRTSWGERYAELVRPGGCLVALMYPIHGDRKGGPPYSLNPEMYQELLGNNFDRIYFETPEGTDGSSRMSVWRRKEISAVAEEKL